MWMPTDQATHLNTTSDKAQAHMALAHSDVVGPPAGQRVLLHHKKAQELQKKNNEELKVSSWTKNITHFPV